MRTREVAEICGVSIPTVTENAKKVGIVMEHGKPHEWTEEELEKVQLELMKNQTNQVVQTESVKGEVLNRFNTGLSLQVIMDSGNLDALEDFIDFARKGTKAQHDLMIEQQKNQLLIEQKEVLQKEVDKYAQWMSASQIKKEYNLPSRLGITTVALELGFERGKDWIEKQYNTDCVYTKKFYSPEAVDRIVEYFYGD